MDFRHLPYMLGVALLAGVVIACESSPAQGPTAPAPTAAPTQAPQTAKPVATNTSTPIPTSAPLPTLTSTPRPPTATPTQTFTPTPNPKAMLLTALNTALTNLKTYRVKVPEESRVIEVILPDKFHQIENEEIIKIGPTLWMNRGGELRAMNMPSVPFFDRANLLWYRDQLSNSPQVILLGPATVENAPVVGYQASFSITRLIPPKTPGPTPQTQVVAQPVKVWMSTVDGFPRRIELGAPNSVSVTFYDFNAKIEIGPP